MALKKETIDKIAGLLKLDNKALADAIAAPEEKDITLTDVQVFTVEELTTRDTAQKAEGKREGETAGKDAGREIAVKEIKKAFGIEIEGKDIPKVVEAVKIQLAKGDEGLKQQVELLHGKLGEKDAEVARLAGVAESVKLDTQLLGLFPKNRAETISDSEYLTLLKSNIEVVSDNGKLVAKRNGEILRDTKTTNPLPLADAISRYFTERKWVAEGTPGGRGGGDGKSTGEAVKMSEAVAAWEAAGKNPASAEFQAHVNVLAKENADFDFVG